MDADRVAVRLFDLLRGTMTQKAVVRKNGPDVSIKVDQWDISRF